MNQVNAVTIGSCSETKVMNLNLIHITTHSHEIFHRLRWGECIACPECGSVHIYNPGPNQLHICADCSNRFSDTSGTIFHSTKVPLVKWLIAIYMFCSQSKGISSYNLARLISVSQPTAWRILTLIRISIKHDLDPTSIAIIDEVYVGADWKKKPAKAKFKHIQPPNPVWNLKGDDLKKYYRSQMLSAASKDKIPVIGINAYNRRSLVLIPYSSSPTIEAIKSQITEHYADINHWVSDDSKLYRWMRDTDLDHSICDHTHRLYKSPDGYSSNRLEGAFSHLKRMYRGIYQWFSRKFSYAYLNEFSWRWSNFDRTIEDRIEGLFGMMI